MKPSNLMELLSRSNGKLNVSEIHDLLANRLVDIGLTPENAKSMSEFSVDYTLGIVRAALLNKRSVSLRHVGTLAVVMRKEVSRFNPLRKKMVHLPKRLSVRFIMSTQLKQNLRNAK